MLMGGFSHFLIGIRLANSCLQVELIHKTPNLFMVHRDKKVVLYNHFDGEGVSLLLLSLKYFMNEFIILPIFLFESKSNAFSLLPSIIPLQLTSAISQKYETIFVRLYLRMICSINMNVSLFVIFSSSMPAFLVRLAFLGIQVLPLNI